MGQAEGVRVDDDADGTDDGVHDERASVLAFVREATGQAGLVDLVRLTVHERVYLVLDGGVNFLVRCGVGMESGGCGQAMSDGGGDDAEAYPGHYLPDGVGRQSWRQTFDRAIHNGGGGGEEEDAQERTGGIVQAPEIRFAARCRRLGLFTRLDEQREAR